jgi:hypothetical protein
VEIVRRLIEAWNRNEQERDVPLERVVPFLDPGVIFDATRRIINPKTYTGIEGIRSMLAERDEVRTGPARSSHSNGRAEGTFHGSAMEAADRSMRQQDAVAPRPDPL